MKSFKEILTEEIKVNTSQYQKANNKKPSGTGKWKFSFNSDMSDPFYITDTYHNAELKAQAKADAAGKSTVYVG